MGKVFITAALTGSIHTPSMSESLPITPDEIAQDAVRAYEAGAALVHVHARNPQTGQPVSDLGLFEEICLKIKERCPIVIIPTTGGGLGMTIEERVSMVPKLKPEMATFNMGSYHYCAILGLRRRNRYAMIFPGECGKEIRGKITTWTL